MSSNHDTTTIDKVNVPYNGHGGTFKNTLAEIDTPDPSIVFKDGFYYMTFTHNGTDVMVMKSRTLDFRTAERKVVWYPPVETMYSANLWAPEIQFIQGKWYIYFAADNGVNENHRMYVLESETADPMGPYAFKGQVKDETDKWAIDGLTLEHEGKLYFIWSGWEGDLNVQQNTYIAPMSNPWTISGPRVLLSQPDLEWEKAGGPPYINEGQSILKKDGRIHIVYSGAGSWTPFYSLGVLTLPAGKDPLNPSDWIKSKEPFMQMDDEAGVYGPGHNTFVKSPDGTEDWIVYHATTRRTDGWNNRKARAQRVSWQESGLPQFGKPLSLDTAIEVPSGSGVYPASTAVKEGEGRLVFTGIPAAVDGEVPLLIHYRGGSESKDGASIQAEVNGKQAGSLKLPPAKQDGTAYAYHTLKLQSGHNALSFSGLPPAIEVTAIEFPRYEAENAQGAGEAVAEENPFASGRGVMQVGVGDGTSVRFGNLQVPEKGEYTLRIALNNLTGSEQKLRLLLNGKKLADLKVPVSERNQYIPVELVKELQPGRFDLTLEGATGSVTVDYLDIVR